jgi:hypothetical protein
VPSNTVVTVDARLSQVDVVASQTLFAVPVIGTADTST